MIKTFNFGQGLVAGIKEDRCDNCGVRRAVIVYQNKEGLLCFQCIAAFFSEAIPVPLNDKELVVGFDKDSTQLIATLHYFADRVLPTIKNFHFRK